MRTRIITAVSIIACVLFVLALIAPAFAHHRPEHAEGKGKPSATVTATPTPTGSSEPTETATPTPTPTTTETVTPTPTPVTGKPDGTNTAILGTLTPMGNPSQTNYITVDGTVIDGREIYGDIKVQARNVVIKNSRLHCGHYIPSGNSGCIDANHGNVYNLLIENNLIVPDIPSYYRDGVVGHEYTAVRNRLAMTNDGFGAFNKASLSKLTNVTIKGNFVHDTVYHRNDPAHSDGTHNDGVQVQGGENILIEGNNFDHTGIVGPSGPDSTKPGAPAPHAHGCGIILQNNTGTPLRNVVVQKNWIDNGLASACIKPGEVTFRENRFGRNQWPYMMRTDGQEYVIRIDSRSSTIVHGLNTNVWDDTGEVLTEGRNTGIWYNG